MNLLSHNKGFQAKAEFLVWKVFGVSLVLAGLSVGTFSVALAQEAPADHVETLVGILEQANCRFDVDALEEAFSKKSKLSYESFESTLFTLGARGGVVVNEETDVAQLYSSECGNEGSNPFTKFIDVMAEHGCIMTESVAGKVLPAAKFKREEIGFIAEAIVATGKADLVDNELRISAPLCVSKNG